MQLFFLPQNVSVWILETQTNSTLFLLGSLLLAMCLIIPNKNASISALHDCRNFHLGLGLAPFYSVFSLPKRERNAWEDPPKNLLSPVSPLITLAKDNRAWGEEVHSFSMECPRENSIGRCTEERGEMIGSTAATFSLVPWCCERDAWWDRSKVKFFSWGQGQPTPGGGKHVQRINRLSPVVLESRQEMKTGCGVCVLSCLSILNQIGVYKENVKYAQENGWNINIDK